MKKSKTTRIIAFIGSLGASAALIGAAAHSTGAYFTDNTPGSLSGSTGHLTIRGTNDSNLNFNNLIPGEDQTKTVSYTTGGDTKSDIWLYFPAGAAYGAFTGAKSTSTSNPSNVDQFAGGGMGRYGHFAVKSSDGSLQFNSYNLQNQPDGTSGCANADGHGSNSPAANVDDTPAYCGVPHYMKLESNVPSGSNGSVTMIFGVTGRATGQGEAQPPATVPFQVVATQAGIRPDAKNF